LFSHLIFIVQPIYFALLIFSLHFPSTLCLKKKIIGEASAGEHFGCSNHSSSKSRYYRAGLKWQQAALKILAGKGV